MLKSEAMLEDWLAKLENLGAEKPTAPLKDARGRRTYQRPTTVSRTPEDCYKKVNKYLKDNASDDADAAAPAAFDDAGAAFDDAGAASDDAGAASDDGATERFGRVQKTNEPSYAMGWGNRSSARAPPQISYEKQVMAKDNAMAKYGLTFEELTKIPCAFRSCHLLKQEATALASAVDAAIDAVKSVLDALTSAIDALASAIDAPDRDAATLPSKKQKTAA